MNKATKVVTASMATAKTANTVKNVGSTKLTNNYKVSTNKNNQRKTNAQSCTTTKAEKRYPDYIERHDVTLTPPRTPAPANYMLDPNTPNCIRGAISAGLAGLSEKKPTVFLDLPQGMPSVIEWGDGWEVDAGFGKRGDVKKEEVQRAVVQVVEPAEKERKNERMESDRSIIHGRSSMARTTMSSAECENVLVNNEEAVPENEEKAVTDTETREVIEAQNDEPEVYEDQPPELESVADDDEEEDPRNASMWVAAYLEDDDTIMNLGDIIVDYDDSIGEMESPMSAGTVHIGDVYGFESERIEKCEILDGVETEEEQDVATELANDDELVNEEETPIETSPETFEKSEISNKNEPLPFQTPFSVQKGERPLTFTEFKNMNQRVLFDPSVDVVEPIQKLYLPENPTVNVMPKPSQQLTIEPQTRYSMDWLYDENENTPVKVESSKRQLKGRVLLLKIGKKISKAKSKGKNVLKQVFVLPLLGGKREESISHNPTDNMVLALPNGFSVPMSPSSVSVASIASSVMTGASKRIIGAIPVSHNQPPPLGSDLPYGAINYTRSATDSTVGDSLPPPPDLLPRPEARESLNDEDAVSLIAAAMMNAGEDEVAFTEEDAASIMATINASEQLDDNDEESVILVVTPREDQKGSYQVISGFDGATPINVKDVLHHLDDNSAIISDLKPNNLQGLFTDKSKKDSSFQIMEADKNVVLTPTTTFDQKHTSNVFRRSTDATSRKSVPIRKSTGTPIVEPALDATHLPNLLPGLSHESDDEEEDETVPYHDGCTIKQASTFGDNTIATVGEIANVEELVKEQDDEATKEKLVAERQPTQTPAAKLVQDMVEAETPMQTPDQPSFSKQAAKNGSFLFSENNMGRAGPRIRAQERAALKQGKAPSSLTMLPASKSMEPKDVNAIISRLSYSSQTSGDAPSRLSTTSQATGSSSPAPLIAIEPTVELKKSFDDSVKVEIQKKIVMSSGIEDRQPSFKTTLDKNCSSDAPKDLNDVASHATLDCSNKSNSSQEFATPLVTNCAQKKKKYPTTPFPDDTLTGEYDPADSIPCMKPQCNISPTASTTSTSSNKKKPSPKQKQVPKSALKTRKGLVKDRISDIQQRIEGSSSVTGHGGRLKKNHSYRLKNQRRMTGGDSVLAPRKATLQNPIFAARSVPIGISKSYSRDDEDDASKFSNASTINDAGSVKSNSVKVGASGYASKYIGNSASSPTSCSSPSSESGTSYVSESTECDPFSTLLAKNTDEDDLSSSEKSPASPKVFFREGKENTNNVNKLPFKAKALVKPTEINQHDKRFGFESSKHRAAPLSRNPSQALSWRQLAAAANNKKLG